MAADHPLAGRASVSLQDLGAYPMALTEPGTTTRRLFELGCALESVQIEPALSCNDPSPLHGFVYGSDAIMLGGYISVTHSLTAISSSRCRSPMPSCNLAPCRFR